MTKRICAALVLAILTLSNSFAEDSSKISNDGKIAIKLSVTGDNGLGQIVTSYLSREFRAIHDVKVMDGNCALTVYVIAMELRNKGGIHTGYALSVVLTSHIPEANALLAVQGVNEKDLFKAADALAATRGTLCNHYVQISSSDGLEQTCKEIAATIDGGEIEELRKFSQKLSELNSKSSVPNSSPSDKAK